MDWTLSPGAYPWAGHLRMLGLIFTCKTTPTFYTVWKFFFLLRATPVAYGSSQARGQIGAAAASLHHSNVGSEAHLGPAPQLKATPDP